MQRTNYYLCSKLRINVNSSTNQHKSKLIYQQHFGSVKAAEPKTLVPAPNLPLQLSINPQNHFNHSTYEYYKTPLLFIQRIYIPSFRSPVSQMLNLSRIYELKIIFILKYLHEKALFFFFFLLFL